MDEKNKKAFDFAADVAKQLITLSTGSVALTITFSKDALGQAATKHPWLLFVSWGIYVVSIMAGGATMMSLAGSLEKQEDPTIYAAGTRTLAVGQIVTFILGTAMLIAYGIAAIVSR